VSITAAIAVAASLGQKMLERYRRTRRWPRHLRRQARFDEAGGTLQDHGRRIGASATRSIALSSASSDKTIALLAVDGSV